MAVRKVVGGWHIVNCLGESGSNTTVEGYSIQHCIEQAEKKLECNIVEAIIIKNGIKYLLLSDNKDEAAYTEIEWENKGE